jgi:hypothetical protein
MVSCGPQLWLPTGMGQNAQREKWQTANDMALQRSRVVYSSWLLFLEIRVSLPRSQINGNDSRNLASTEENG